MELGFEARRIGTRRSKGFRVLRFIFYHRCVPELVGSLRYVEKAHPENKEITLVLGCSITNWARGDGESDELR